MSAARRWSIISSAGSSAAINTDDHNEIEYGFARTLGRTDWDAAGALYRQSVEIGDHRPPVSGGAVDWKAVALRPSMGCGGPRRQEALRR